LAFNASSSFWRFGKIRRWHAVRGTQKLFTGYRKTVLCFGEILLAIKIPKAKPGIRRLEKSFKVSKRKEMDISIVSAAFF